MTNERRLEIYTRHLDQPTQDGTYRLTPAQRRRAQKKFNKNKQ